MSKQYFPQIGKIPFEGPESKNPMAFHYYDAEKVVAGKKMKDWMRFAMAWWHTLCAEGADQFGGGTKTFPWNQGANAVEIAKNKALARVGDCVRAQHGLLEASFGQEHCTLVMEEGNHFTDNAGRLARAFAWCIERI